MQVTITASRQVPCIGDIATVRTRFERTDVISVTSRPIVRVHEDAFPVGILNLPHRLSLFAFAVCVECSIAAPNGDPEPRVRAQLSKLVLNLAAPWERLYELPCSFCLLVYPGLDESRRAIFQRSKRIGHFDSMDVFDKIALGRLTGCECHRKIHKPFSRILQPNTALSQLNLGLSSNREMVC